MTKKPSELTEGEWIKITLDQHPDAHIDGQPDPEIGHPSGAIIVEVDYGQTTMSSTDKDAAPGSEGILILHDHMPGAMAMMDSIVEWYLTQPHATVTTGKHLN